jgi:two-component system phosphate regulon sensor histidine kinase PhoR
MSKRILWILTISLSLSILGLIIVQIKWIRNAIELNDKQFRQLVNTTLTDVSMQIDHYYTSKRINSVIEEKILAEDEIVWNIVIEEKENPNIFLDEEKIAEIMPHLQKVEKGEELIEVIEDTIIVITQLGNKKVDTINIFQYQEGVKLKKIEEGIREKEILFTRIMKKMLLEDVSFEERVEQKKFEQILSKNIVDHGIDLDFEYTVIKNNKQEVYQSCEFDKHTDCYYYRAGLMSDQIIDDTFLYLYFPGQKAHVRASVGFLLSSTVILTLLMIVLFSFALYVIFKQKKLSDVKNDFVNNMTHELKTPISTISLASQMLNDDSIPSEKKNTAHISRIIQTESKRLGYQVERVLQMAVLDQGHLVLKKSRIGMHEIVAIVMQNFKLQVESQNGKLEVIDESVCDLVNGDKVHLMNVVTNLMDNALKYSKDNPKIEVRMNNTVSTFNLKVKDNGIGISKENQRKVFDRFFRVSTGNVHDVKGFGLGLSYVKLIIEQHGGSINLSSDINKGTEFLIKLPLYTET